MVFWGSNQQTTFKGFQMNNIEYIKKVISNFISNFHFLGKFRLKEDVFSKDISFNQIRKTLIEFYFDVNKAEASEYAMELNYLRSQNNIPMIPYEQSRKIDYPVYAEFDSKKKLPFVIHKSKRLYFPKDWSLEKSKKQYRYFIERENLLGGNYTPKAPHQCQSESFKIEKGDVLLDIGSAEGLVALDTIEKTKKTFLYESDPIWAAPLKATFEPYKDKVIIINKLVSDTDSQTTTTLSTSIQGLEKETFFVKMDIEGAEEFVIKGNANFFQNNKIKAACCTYHNANHYNSLKNIFEKWGYSTTPSDGNILCFMDNNFVPPYFRKGLIRATNII